MPQLRIALAQINPTVGELSGNARLIVEWTRRAAGAGAQLVVFPYLALTGYPVEDLVTRETFLRATRQQAEELANLLLETGCGDIPVVVSYPDRSRHQVQRSRDVVAVAFQGELVAEQCRHHLVSRADHTNCPGEHKPTVLRLQGADIGITSDIDETENNTGISSANLYARDEQQTATLDQSGIGLLLAPVAAPYRKSVTPPCIQRLRDRAQRAGLPIVCTNLVGGQDDLVFGGGSFIVDPRGQLVQQAEQFSEQLLVTDVDLPTGPPLDHLDNELLHHEVLETEASSSRGPLPETAVRDPLSDEAELWTALVTGLRDYIRKGGFRSVILGFSGGIDSALVAALAVDALGPDSVHGVAMPSRYSTEHSRSDAADLAFRLGCHFRTEPVETMVNTYVDQLHLAGVAEENIQARVRGMLLMALSNMEGHLVLAAGNKTELAVGYSTIYGDSVGGFAPIKDVLKTQVWALARWRNTEAERRGHTPPIPENSITKPPSAELRPDQFDTDSLPDYALLDRILDGYLEGIRGYDDLVDAGLDRETVHRVLGMVDRAEYKRRQYPIGPMITSGKKGRGRTLPLTNSWREGT